jgi:hypothetical protein
MLQPVMILQQPPVAMMLMSGGKVSFGHARIAVCIDTACPKCWSVLIGRQSMRCGGR